jgi:hypothetical protein
MPQIRFAVIDTGIGIFEKQKNIFQETAHDRKFGGTGWLNHFETIIGFNEQPLTTESQIDCMVYFYLI